MIDYGGSMWTIYHDPSDFPGLYVARRFMLDVPTNDIFTAKTIENIRSMLPFGLHRLDRDPRDDSKIVEVWI